MYTKKFEFYSGYCPEFYENQTLEITYVEASVLGTYKKQRKVLSANSPNSNLCNLGNDCPILKKAITVIQK